MFGALFFIHFVVFQKKLNNGEWMHLICYATHVLYFQTCFSGLNTYVLKAVFLSVQEYDTVSFGEWFLTLEDEGSTLLWNVRSQSCSDTALHLRKLCVSRHGVHGAESAAFSLENKCCWYCVPLHSVRGRAVYKLFWNYQALIVIWFYSEITKQYFGVVL
jgi:hypothetical protein